MYAYKINTLDVDHVIIGNRAITFSNKANNLGVFIHNDLSMESQLNHVCKLSYLELRRLAHLRPYLNMDAMKKLMSAFVLSRLDYCNSLFAGLSNDKITKLQRIQNNAARLVLKQPKRHHISPLLKDLHWLPIKARIDYKVALLCFKCLSNNAPAYKKDLIVPYTPARMLRSSSSNLLSTPRVSSKKYGERAFTFSGPQIWNSLLENIRSEKGLEKF